MNQSIKQTQIFLNIFYKKACFYNENNLWEPLKEDGNLGPKTKATSSRFIEHLKKVMFNKNYLWDSLNLIAVRLDNSYTDLASDWLFVVSNSTLYAVPCSTKPGRYWVYNPVSYGGITGTASLIPNQYVKAYKFITNKVWSNLWLGTPYFMQTGEVSIIRDTNRDNTLDKNMPVQKGYFGINIHTSGLNYIIWDWSAGCIVIPRMFWIELVNLFLADEFYNFTLLEAKDL